MYDILKQHIRNGSYKLTDMTHRIKRMYAMGDLTDEQMDELLALANAGANIDNERPALLAMIEALAARVEKLEQVAAAPPETGETPAYREWQPWDGVSKDYQQGAIVSHNGKVWESVFAGQNVWEPGAPGIDERYWAEHA